MFLETFGESRHRTMEDPNGEMIVDFPAPAHPATINNVSKSFLGGSIE